MYKDGEKSNRISYIRIGYFQLQQLLFPPLTFAHIFCVVRNIQFHVSHLLAPKFKTEFSPLYISVVILVNIKQMKQPSILMK